MSNNNTLTRWTQALIITSITFMVASSLIHYLTFDEFTYDYGLFVMQLIAYSLLAVVILWKRTIVSGFILGSTVILIATSFIFASESPLYSELLPDPMIEYILPIAVFIMIAVTSIAKNNRVLLIIDSILVVLAIILPTLFAVVEVLMTFFDGAIYVFWDDFSIALYRLGIVSIMISLLLLFINSIRLENKKMESLWKDCPKCAERIKIKASVCRYCGQTFDRDINAE